LNGILLGMVFSILALSGFEAAAPLAEEAKRPADHVYKAIMWSLFVVGVFYIFSTWTTAIGFGTSKKDMAAFGNTDYTAFYGAAKTLWHSGWILIYFAIINSCLGVGISCTNAATRVMYTMGRAGTLPSAFATIHPKFKTPSFAIHVQQLLGILAFVLVAIVLGENQIFGFLGTATTVALIVMYSMANVALYVYVRREHLATFNVWRHAIMPALGTFMLVVVLYKTITSNQAYPLNWAPWVVVGWLILGAIVMVWVETTSPRAFAEANSTAGLPVQ
jgi:amino acid transporter